jgi:uncharacterized protein YwqG
MDYASHPDFDVWRQHFESTRRVGVVLDTVNRPIGLEFYGSAIGGFPRMPKDIDWPHSGSTGAPMDHLVEIDLEGLPAFADRSLLPETGALHLFGTSDYYDSPAEPPPSDFRVLWLPTRPQDSAPRERPPSREGGYQLRYGERPKQYIEPTVLWTYEGGSESSYTQPPPGWSNRESSRAETFLRTQLISKSLVEAYGPPREAIGSSYTGIANRYGIPLVPSWDSNPWCSNNQLLGHAVSALNSFALAASKVVLFQLESTRELPWGDMGWLVIWIDREDLVARRFDRVGVCPYFHY